MARDGQECINIMLDIDNIDEFNTIWWLEAINDADKHPLYEWSVEKDASGCWVVRFDNYIAYMSYDICDVNKFFFDNVGGKSTFDEGWYDEYFAEREFNISRQMDSTGY